MKKPIKIDTELNIKQALYLRNLINELKEELKKEDDELTIWKAEYYANKA